MAAKAGPAAAAALAPRAASGASRSPGVRLISVPIARSDVASGRVHEVNPVNVPPAKKARTPDAAESGDKAAPQSAVDFEKSLARLEDVVKRLEQPNLPLTDAMKLFEEGLQLAQNCQKQLQEAEGRVEILLKSADGKLAAEPFRPKGADEDLAS